MDNDTIADLKQFIEATINQQLAQQKQTIVSEIGERFDTMDKRFDDNDEKIDEILNAVGGDLNKHSTELAEHDVRIKQLQKKIA